MLLTTSLACNAKTQRPAPSIDKAGDMDPWRTTNLCAERGRSNQDLTTRPKAVLRSPVESALLRQDFTGTNIGQRSSIQTPLLQPQGCASCIFSARRISPFRQGCLPVPRGQARGLCCNQPPILGRNSWDTALPVFLLCLRHPDYCGLCLFTHARTHTHVPVAKRCVA